MVVAAELDGFEDKAANDAHGFSEITLDMLRDWMDRDSIDDRGFTIVSRVHNTTACGGPNQACWNGHEVTYGDGDEAGTYAYSYSSGLDVVAHEIAHGFTEFHSHLSYSDQPGALNESVSDVAGVVAEHYHEGDSGDFFHGDDIHVTDKGVRDMRNPDMDRDHASDYVDGMDRHRSSGPPNRAFVLAVGRHEAVGAGHSKVEAVRDLGHIWFTANAGYWTSGTQYTEGCRGTIDAARALGYDGEVVEALHASWADVGIECESDVFVCDDDGDCDAGDGETCASCAEDCGACSQDCSSWKKLKCELGIGDCSHCGDHPPACDDGICDGDETDETCPADCGCSAFDCPEVAPFGCWCDAGCEEIGDCCADVIVCRF